MLGASLTMNSFYGGGKLTQEADNVLIIQKKQKSREDDESSDWTKYLHVCAIAVF